MRKKYWAVNVGIPAAPIPASREVQATTALTRFRSHCAVLLFLLYTSPAAFGQITVIKNKDLVIELNQYLQTRINSYSPGAGRLMNDFHSSEYLVTKYFTANDFLLNRKFRRAINDSSGRGTEWIFSGMDNKDHLEKIISIKTYDRFPGAAFYLVKYVNHGTQALQVQKWVNHSLSIDSLKDGARFWSFMGATYPDRRDWIQKVDRGFYQENFMGMNATDYGGGIPLIDLWRRDAGIAIGHTEPMPRLVSLPVDFDRYAAAPTFSIAYDYPQMLILKPADTLSTYQTFVCVHRGDCFETLRTYAQYMATRGIKSAPSEPNAYEPVWCAWGYDRDFTIQQIMATLPKVKALGIRWIGLDDGYQQALGDWHTNEKFVHGDADMKAFVDRVHGMGMKAVLWWTPLAAAPESKLLKADPNLILIRKDGSPEYINWWNSFLMAPTYKNTVQTTAENVRLFLKDWDFDALKLDGTFLNACSPDYGSGHDLDYPEQASERFPQFFKTLYSTARQIKPHAVLELCPCGACMSFYNMPYVNQFVASDPLNSWQVRLRAKVYKALMPETAYFGDHVELTDGMQDFASQIGVGAVPGTKFIWPATGNVSKDSLLLTPEKEILFKKWLTIYRDKFLSTGTYRGELYDIGYDLPETHCIEKDGRLYYAFYNPHYEGFVELRGLEPGKTYHVVDYFNDRDYGNLKGPGRKIKVSFNQFLVLEASPGM